jgi:hypothetical protein
LSIHRSHCVETTLDEVGEYLRSRESFRLGAASAAGPSGVFFVSSRTYFLALISAGSVDSTQRAPIKFCVLIS